METPKSRPYNQGVQPGQQSVIDRGKIFPEKCSAIINVKKDCTKKIILISDIYSYNVWDNSIIIK